MTASGHRAQKPEKNFRTFLCAPSFTARPNGGFALRVNDGSAGLPRCFAEDLRLFLDTPKDRRSRKNSVALRYDSR